MYFYTVKEVLENGRWYTHSAASFGLDMFLEWVEANQEQLSIDMGMIGKFVLDNGLEDSFTIEDKEERHTVYKLYATSKFDYEPIVVI